MLVGPTSQGEHRLEHRFEEGPSERREVVVYARRNGREHDAQHESIVPCLSSATVNGSVQDAMGIAR